MTQKTKILVIEDEPAIRDGICDVLVYNGYDVTAVGDGKAGLLEAQNGGHHLIILDVMLPEMDGFSVCETFRSTDKTTPIIMLTAKTSEDDIVNGLKLGADDYMPKPFSIRELLARIECALRRHPRPTPQDQTKAAGFTIDHNNLNLQFENKSCDITNREAEILSHLIAKKNQTISRGELLKEVWGYTTDNIDTRTVDIHMAKLRKKIESLSGNTDQIVTIRGKGYQWKEA